MVYDLYLRHLSHLNASSSLMNKSTSTTGLELCSLFLNLHETNYKESLKSKSQTLTLSPISNLVALKPPTKGRGKVGCKMVNPSLPQTKYQPIYLNNYQLNQRLHKPALTLHSRIRFSI